MPKAAGKKRNGAVHGSGPYSHAGKGSAANHIFKMKTVRLDVYNTALEAFTYTSNR